MDKLGYRQDNDVLIHVGDLVAKGEKNNEVLGWMAQRRVLGVRGNHDQPVR
jgi:predicted phosphodiesterase